MNILHTVVFATLLATPTQPTQVLAPTAESAVSALVQINKPLSGGVRVDASIQKDRVLVTVGEADAWKLAVTLLHASQAEEGDTVIGELALRPKPGPAPKAMVASIAKRVRAGGGKLPWATVAPNEDPKPEPVVAEGADVGAIAEQLTAAEHRLETGEPDMAKTFLESIPAKLQAPAAVEVALLWRRQGDTAKAKAVLDAAGKLPPMLEAAKSLILTDAVPANLAGVEAKRRCGYSQLAEMALSVGLADKAEVLLKSIMHESPDCIEAVDEHLQLLVQTGRGAEASALARPALARFPDDTRILSSGAAVYIANGKLQEAIPLLEKAALGDMKRRNPLRVLLGTVVRDPKTRDAQKLELAKRLTDNPDDVVAAFLLGVIRHYSNEFVKSNQLLTNLEGSLDHSDRLHIYRAMNDFNLGQTDKALSRLQRIAMRPDPDPDVYYCLAEIQRDTDRAAAKKNLARYVQLSHKNPLSHANKEERVQRLASLLDECLGDGRPECWGEWEHPRLRHEEKSQHEDARVDSIRSATIFGVLILGLLLMLRRRRARKGTANAADAS